jgi:hypothetical protein
MTALKNEVRCPFVLPSLSVPTSLLSLSVRQNKQLEETVDRYLEQIHELESAKNSANTTAKMVEKVRLSPLLSAVCF